MILLQEREIKSRRKEFLIISSDALFYFTYQIWKKSIRDSLDISSSFLWK